MIHDYELDLTWADDPPKWAENIGPLMEYWSNPIFQRRYVLGKMAPTLGPKKAFFAGIVCSLFLNLLLFYSDRENAVAYGLVITIIVPGASVLLMTAIRLFSSCMIATPNELRGEFASDSLGALLTTPISDRRIFIAECLSGVMRGLGAIEEIIALIFGLAVPYLLVMGPLLAPGAKELGIHLLWWIFFGIMVLLILVLFLLFGAYSSGYYAVLMPLTMSVPIAIAHVLLSVFFMNMILFFGIYVLMMYIEIEKYDPLMWSLILAGFEVFIISILMTFTVILGTHAFARARRPGYYEPYGCTAAEMLERTESLRQFGRRI